MKRTSHIFLIFSALTTTYSHSEEVSLFDLSLDELLQIELKGANVSHIDLFAAPVTNNAFSQPNLMLPRSIEIINADTMNARGIKNIVEAVENMTGILAGESPSEPYSFSTRGFSRDSINVTYDGISMGVATFNTRPLSTFNVQSVEFIKGASELAVGQVGAGGTINIVTKKAKKSHHHIREVLVSLGEYNTNSYNLGASGPISDNSAYRIDVSTTSSDGWVNNTESESHNISASTWWSASENIEFLFSVNWQDDELPAYWGTPFVPAERALIPKGKVIDGLGHLVIDEAMRFLNYNVADNEISSTSHWQRIDAKWRYSDALNFEASLYQFSADRDWRNAENYLYNPTLDAIERDRLLVKHDRNNWGVLFKSNIVHSVFGKSSQSTIELSHHNIDFDRIVGFNLASPSNYWDSVDLYTPVAGEFGFVDRRQDFLTQGTTSVIATNNIELSESFNLHTQIKSENIAFDRRYINWDGSVRDRTTINTNLSDVSFLLGGTYKVSDEITAYAHYSHANDPIFSDFRFTYDIKNAERSTVRQFEIGTKAVFDDGNSELTLALFSIKKSVVTQASADSALFDSVQNSRGIDFSINSKLSEQIDFATNIALVDAQYNTFFDAEIEVQADGNTPVNVPDTMANIAISYMFEQMPIETGVKLLYVSSRWANSVNTTKLQDYTTANIFVAYHGNNYHLALHINNVTDELYGPWSDIFYSNQVILAPPKLIELTYKLNF